MWDIRQDERYANYMSGIGWDVDKVSMVYLYSKKLPLVGVSVTKIQRPQVLLKIDEIRTIVKQRKSVYVSIEVADKRHLNYYKSMGFKTTTSPSLPTKTVLIDLSKSRKKLLKEMHHKTRYNIKMAKRNNNVIKFSQDIDKYVQEWQKAAYDRGMFISQKREISTMYDEFKNTSKILFAYNNQELVAGLLHVTSHGVSYYMQAFATKKGKKLNAPTLLTWESIQVAKKEKSNYYNFEGIYDDRAPLPAWKGFSRFKRSFGGDVIYHDLPQKKFIFPFFL